MTTRFRLPDGRLVSHEVAVDLPDEFLPPYTLHRFTPEDLALRGITKEELPPDPEPAIDLPRVRRDLKDAIDRDAEAMRARFITSGAGMAMTYQEKLAQARAALADAQLLEGEYPLLEASIGIEGDSVMVVAALVINRYNLWVQAASVIETWRLSSKAAIDEATTIEALRAVMNAPRPQL